MTSGASETHRRAGPSDEAELLRRAREGDEAAFAGLVEPQRARLRAHCYRMTGSVQDAEDAVQEALVRAWRSLARFDGRSAFSSWLYRIATNRCLTMIERRGPRLLPLEQGYPTGDPSDAAEPPLAESVWIEPYPDDLYEERETLELAFVAAVQHLPPNGRAALLLTEVLGYSAHEAAEMLGTTTASLNSAVQRARKIIGERVPGPSQQATLRSLGDGELDAVVGRYMAAMESADVDEVVSLLAEEATWSMPPQPAWFRGHEAIAAFLGENPFRWFEWRHRPVWVNGQPATAAYSLNPDTGRFQAHSLDVLTLRSDGAITAVTAFLDVTRRGVTDAGFRSFAASGLFEAVGMPTELPEEPAR